MTGRVDEGLQVLASLFPDVVPEPPAHRGDSAWPAWLVDMCRALIEADQHEWGLVLCREAVALAPDGVDFRVMLGYLLTLTGQLEEAVSQLAHALALMEDHAAARRLHGAALLSLGRVDDAIATHGRLASVTRRAEDYERVAACFQGEPAARVIAGTARMLEGIATPRDVALAAANALTANGRSAEAIGVAASLFSLDAGDVEACSTLAWALRLSGDSERASGLFERSAAIAPGNPEAVREYARDLFFRGRLEDARAIFKATPAALPGGISRRCALWLGQPLSGKTLLIHLESAGLGDAIQWVRFAPCLRERGARVVIETRKPVASLLAAIDGVDRVVTRWEPRPDVDYHCWPVTPWVFLDMPAAALGQPAPYVGAAASVATARAAWRTANHDDLLIGVVWEGSDARGVQRRPVCGFRSMPGAMLRPLGQLPGVRLCCLQKRAPDRRERDGGPLPPMIERQHEWRDFAELASLVAGLDLVITIDTAVAHLAGALGTPVWILLPHAAEWRWGVDGRHTHWYPTARLFRQPAPGAWTPVVTEVLAGIQRLIDRRPVSVSGRPRRHAAPSALEDM